MFQATNQCKNIMGFDQRMTGTSSDFQCFFGLGMHQ